MPTLARAQIFRMSMHCPKFFSVVLTIPLTVGLSALPNGLSSPPFSAAALAQVFPDLSSPFAQRILQAQALIDFGFTEEGIAIYEQALKQMREQGNRLREAEFLQSIGSEFETRRQYQKALIFYQRALEIYTGRMISAVDRYNQVLAGRKVANQIGSLYRRIGQPAEALAAHQRARAIDQQAKSGWTEADTLVQIGMVYTASGQPAQALAAFQQALALHKNTGSSVYEIPRLLNRIGLIYQAQGELKLALATYQTALSALKDVKEPNQLSNQVLTLENIIHLYQSQGQAEKAATYTEQVMSALNATLQDQPVEGDYSRQAAILTEIGEFYLTERQLDRAKQYFDRALRLARRSPNDYSYRESNLLGSIVIAYEKEGLLEQTIPYKQRTAAVFEGMGLWENTASSLQGLAGTYQAVGQFQQALDTYQQAITVYQKAQEEYGGQSTSIARVLQQMGQVHASQGQLEQAEKIYQKALAQYQESGFSLGQIFVLERLAELYTMQGQGEQAERYAQQAKSLRNQTQLN